MTWAAAGAAVAMEGALGGAPKRVVKHGRGHAHHHTIYEKAGTAPDSLNAIAQTRGLAFGSAIGTSLKAAANIPSLSGFRKKPSSYDDAQYRALFIEQCGILVPENELKWYVVRRTPGKFDFERADLLLAFADRYQLSMRGHTLLWNRTKWMPEWVAKYDFGTSPALKAEKMLKDHINTVCKRFGQRIFSYDVVNETIAPATGEYEDSPFTKALGPDVIDICFRAAREAAPHAELVYNDYMSWNTSGAAHRAGVLKLLDRLRKNNVPVDALGIQAHIGSNGMGTATGLLGDADEKEWRAFLDAVSELGYKLVITEFDVNDQSVAGTPAERDRIVADYAKAYLDIALSYPNLRYVMAWGLVDKFSWLQNTGTRADGAPKRCTPYDDTFKAKPLRDAMAQAFAAAPARTPLFFNPA